MLRRQKSPPPRISRQPARTQPTPQSFSYHDARARRELDSDRRTTLPQHQARLAKPGRTHLSYVLVIVVLLFVVIYELGLSPTPKVVVTDTGSLGATMLQPLTVYQQAAQKLFKDSIDNRTKVTINTGILASDLERQFPQLATVSINVPFIGHQPTVSIEAAQPEIVFNSQATGSFLLSSSGLALAANNQDMPSRKVAATLPVVIDQTGINVQLGHQVLANSDVSFILLVVAQLKAQNIAVQSLVLPAATRELDVYLTGQPYFVKFNLDTSSGAGQQIGTFLAARQYLVGHNITPSTYIDARSPGRVYYK